MTKSSVISLFFFVTEKQTRIQLWTSCIFEVSLKLTKFLVCFRCFRVDRFDLMVKEKVVGVLNKYQSIVIARHENKNDAIGSCARGIIRESCNRTPGILGLPSQGGQSNSENIGPKTENSERILDPEDVQHARSLSVAFLAA